MSMTIALADLTARKPPLQAVTTVLKDKQHSPVFITDNGEVTNVIVSYEQYLQLQMPKMSVADAFRAYQEPIAVDVDFQANRKSQLATPFEFD